MNRYDVEKIVRWAVDTDLKKFAEDAYGVTGTAFNRSDDYLKAKFRQMQSDFIMWLAGLSESNRGRLAREITFNTTEKENNNEKK